MKDFSAEVKRGVQLLNREVTDWYDLINLDLLDILHGDQCVLGQLFGDYVDGLRELGLTAKESNAHGFCFGYDLANYSYAGWADLTEQWKSAIRELRSV